MSIENLVGEAFGPLQGVKIVWTGTLIAQPFAAELAAEMGAEVIRSSARGAATRGGGPSASDSMPKTVVIPFRRTSSRNGATFLASRWIFPSRKARSCSLR